MDKKILYAAYGSNINLEQMAFRCPEFYSCRNGYAERL